MQNLLQIMWHTKEQKAIIYFRQKSKKRHMKKFNESSNQKKSLVDAKQLLNSEMKTQNLILLYHKATDIYFDYLDTIILKRNTELYDTTTIDIEFNSTGGILLIIKNDNNDNLKEIYDAVKNYKFSPKMISDVKTTVQLLNDRLLVRIHNEKA